MKLWQLLVLVAVVAGGFGLLAFLSYQPGAGGELFRQKPSFVQGFYAGTTRQLTVDNAGNVVNSGTFTLNGETTLGNCGTATWNPGSVATNTLAAVTSTDIALTGAALGDVCLGSLTSATSTSALLNCTITGTATATIQLTNVGAVALDLATGTAKVCYFD